MSTTSPANDVSNIAAHVQRLNAVYPFALRWSYEGGRYHFTLPGWYPDTFYSYREALVYLIGLVRGSLIKAVGACDDD